MTSPLLLILFAVGFIGCNMCAEEHTHAHKHAPDWLEHYHYHTHPITELACDYSATDEDEIRVHTSHDDKWEHEWMDKHAEGTSCVSSCGSSWHGHVSN